MEEIREQSIDFDNSFISFESEEIVTNRLVEIFTQRGIETRDIKEACKLAWEELLNAREDLKKKGEETIAYLKASGRKGIVLAGRPYHIDPEIHHGIAEMINSFGVAVLTEDAISHLAEIDRPTIVVDQWMYHSRLYAAASYVRTQPNLELVQLNSFGCGLDAVTTDQVNDILTTQVKYIQYLRLMRLII